MAYSVSMNFACTYQMCSKKYYQLCLYKNNAFTENNQGKLYNPANSLSDVCADCGVPACQNALCTNAFTPGKLFPPTEKRFWIWRNMVK
ncbi:hypothetical protein ANCCAN_28516 [Ancylostoma caninum]|uniref:Uncharacterized protein n=2 Tax=Ancylostoma caninum TaxID=29170 RepID=A0A368F439_ANCCA|nr:hypothetical protein ANCCAN_28516 [Ancylostoma caninum]